MSWLLIIGLKNAILVAPLAFLAFGIGRYSKRPALAHVLWLIVLVKLLTPPLVDVPMPAAWQVDVESLLAASGDAGSEALPAAAVEPTGTIDRTLACADPATTQSTVIENSVSPLPAAVNPAACDVIPSAPTAEKRSTAAPLRAAWLRGPAIWMGLLSAVWLVGSAVSVVLLALRAWRFHRFVRLAARIDDGLAARVAVLARSVGLGGGPRVVVVEGVVSPMLWGVGAGTRLIFPARLAERLNAAEVDSLLLHELAHYSRGDHWVRLLELAAHVLYWWHPVVWFARREIEAAEEQCCDAWVVEHQHGSRRSYAEALLTTIDFLCEPQETLPPAACGLGEVPLLRMRLTQIMRGQLAGGLSRGVQAIVLCIGVAISPLQPALWATSSSPLPKPVPVQPPPERPIVQPAPESPPDNTSATGSSAPAESPAAPSTEPSSPVPVELPARAAPLRWSAVSPNSRYRLEERRSGVTLVHVGTTWKMDLSAYDIRCASFAPDSRSFVTGQADGTLRWWDCETGGNLYTLGDKSGAITSVAFGRDNQVAAGTSSGIVSVYDLISSAETRLSVPSAVACVRWSADGKRLAVGLGHYQDSQGSVLIWDPHSTIQPDEYSLARPVGALSWLDGSSLLVADWSGQGQVFDAATGELTPAGKIQKILVSAANWSPNCPLVSPWQAGELAREVVR